MASNIGEHVTAEIRTRMAQKKATQAQLGKALGLSQVSISKRLSGRIAFDVEELAATAEFLGVSVQTLIRRPTR